MFFSAIILGLHLEIFRASELWYPKREYYDLFEKEYGINIPVEARVTKLRKSNPPAGSDIYLIMTLQVPIIKEDEILKNINYQYGGNGGPSIDGKREKELRITPEGVDGSITLSYYKPKGDTRKIVVRKQVYREGSQEVINLIPWFIGVYW